MRFIYFMMLAALYLVPASSQAEEPKSINFIVFVNNDPLFQYDPIMFGSFSQFIKSMGSSQVLLLAHNPKVIDGDVMNLQQDALRERADGNFSDAGINCHLSLGHESVGPWEHNIEGNCQIINKFHGKQQTLQAKVSSTELPGMVEGKMVWIEVYEDKRTGIAFYANLSER